MTAPSTARPAGQVGAPGIAVENHPLYPFPAIVRAIAPEAPGVRTYRLEFNDADRQLSYRVEPGQFNMLYLPGVGEVPISVSGGADEGPGIAHTIRAVGRVTRALEALTAGCVVGMRGPYGTHWPMIEARGKDVLLVAGGLGLAPLRLAIKRLLADRSQYGRIVLLYGARQPADLLYASEYSGWKRQGLELAITVDHGDASWHGSVGVVPMLLRRLRIVPGRTVLLACGPEVMMRFSVAEALADQIPDRDIYLTLERNMQCAVGLCGHCQLGPEFLCKDGPVFAYPKISRFFNQRNF